MIALFATLSLASTSPTPPLAAFNLDSAHKAAQHLFGADSLGDLLFGPRASGASSPPAANLSLQKLKPCDSGFTQLASNRARAKLSRLIDLPDADMEIAVNRNRARRLPVRTVVAYKVSR